MGSGIYALKNVVNGKRYIGKSENIEKRCLSHFNKLRRGDHVNAHLQASYDKYGIESFISEVLEQCTISKLNKREQHWISKLKTTDKKFGYNKTFGGTGGRLSADSLKKMADSLRGRRLSHQQRQAISRKHKRNKVNVGAKNGMFGKIPWNKGKTIFTDPVLKAMGEASKQRHAIHGSPITGIRRSKKTRRKMSKGMRGLVKSEEHKRKLAESLRGRKLSEKTRLKLSIARRGIPQKKLICPHCFIKGRGSSMIRWHFNHCLKNPNRISIPGFKRQDTAIVEAVLHRYSLGETRNHISNELRLTFHMVSRILADNGKKF